MFKNNKDIRDIFFNNIKKKFIKNKNSYILTNDADVFSLTKHRANTRFIDAGVAEQNLINIAAGLSASNKKVLVFGFCTFLTFRCYEQIRFNVASMKKDLKIIGLGPGYSFPYDGPTHHAIQDLYLMYLIPELEVINISDNNLANKISKNLNKIKGPAYIRLDKGAMNHFNNINYNLNKGFEFIYRGKSKKTLIISSGYFCKKAYGVASKLDHVSVINFFRFKNFNKILLIKNMKDFKRIFIYDENSKNGGISNIILHLINDNKLNIKVKILSSPEKQLFKYSNNREDIYNLLGINDINLLKMVN